MSHRLGASVLLLAATTAAVLLAAGQDPAGKQSGQKARDPAAEAFPAKGPAGDRPEQKQTAHDKSEKFDWKKPAPISPALKDQPNGGRIAGFEFSRDPLGAD